MSRTTYAVRAVEPRSVASEVARIWNDNLKLALDAAARFDWVYRDAPEPPPQVLVLSASAPGGEPQLVGTAGIARRRVQVGERLLRAAHLVDLAVDAPHRALGPALSLVREARRLALAEQDFAYGFPNAKARGVFARAGYASLRPVARYARVLRHESYLERYLGASLLATVIGAVLDGTLGAWRAPARLFAARRFRLELLDAPDARFDELWERCRGQYDVVGWRGAELLRWRFFGGHRGRRRIAALCRKQTLLAYAVLEREGGVVHVRDLFGERRALGALFDLLLPRLAAEGASSVSFMLLGPPAVVALLQSRGFWEREQERVPFFDAPAPELRRALSDASRWWITDADDDS